MDKNRWNFRLGTQRFTMTRRRPGSSPSARDRGSSISKSSVALAYAAGGTQRRRTLAGPKASAGAGTPTGFSHISDSSQMTIPATSNPAATTHPTRIDVTGLPGSASNSCSVKS